MFSDKHYVPAIRWRQGEYSALQELRPQQRNTLTPLVDIPPIPWDFEAEQPARSIDDHMANVPKQMAAAWGIEAPIFVDLGLVETGLITANGLHPLDFLFDRLSAEKIQAIPVTATDRDNDYQQAVRTIVARDKRGLCLRASPDDLEIEDLSGALPALYQGADVGIGDVDLVLDFRAIESSQVALLRRLIVNALHTIPDIKGYRTLTLLTGAFPVNLANTPIGVSLIPRADWALWLSLRSATAPRIPSFGDYTAAHPDQEEIDPRFMQPSASIRYAADTDWLVVRGRSVRAARYGGFGQFPQLSQMLKQQPQFAGNSFSWASDFIDACAAGGPTGSLMSWRKVATNRHIALTHHQIANLP